MVKRCHSPIGNQVHQAEMTKSRFQVNEAHGRIGGRLMYIDMCVNNERATAKIRFEFSFAILNNISLYTGSRKYTKNYIIKIAVLIFL